MFRAITEISVLVQLHSDPLITPEFVLSKLVRIAPDTSIVGSNPGRPNFFYYIFLCFHVKEMRINTKHVSSRFL